MRLLDALWHYDALVARVPLSQWRTDDSVECAECQCAYVQLEAAEQEAKARGREVRPARRRMIKPCTHREKGQVDPGKLFVKPYPNPRADDPHAVVALKSDIDRLLNALPGQARDLFDLRYRSIIRDPKTGERRQRTLAEVRIILRRPWDVINRCHDYHLARMERELIDWFVPDRRAA